MNVAVALSRLGQRAELATSFADDAAGELIANYLELNGVRLASNPKAIARTARAVAGIDPYGSATYEFDLDWNLNRINPSGPPETLHVGSIAATLHPGAQEVTSAVSRFHDSALVTYDLNLRPEIVGRSNYLVHQVETLARQSDVVKASAEDLASLYPGLGVRASATRLRQLGPTAVVVTTGALGALALTPAGTIRVASPAVTVADTIGAGDTFMAGVIAALLERGLVGRRSAPALARLGKLAWRSILQFATAAAAVSVTRVGADPPLRAEVGLLSPATLGEADL